MNCPKCQKEINDDFKLCPHCGKRLTPRNYVPLYILAVVVLVVGAWFLGRVSQPDEALALQPTPVPTVMTTPKPTPDPTPEPTATPEPEMKSPEDYGLNSDVFKYDENLVNWFNDAITQNSNIYLVSNAAPLLEPYIKPLNQQIRYQITSNIAIVFYLEGEQNYIRDIVLLANQPTSSEEATLVCCYIVPMMIMTMDSSIQSEQRFNDELDRIKDRLSFNDWFKYVPDSWYFNGRGGIHTYETEGGIFNANATFVRENPWE